MEVPDCITVDTYIYIYICVCVPKQHLRAIFGTNSFGTIAHVRPPPSYPISSTVIPLYRHTFIPSYTFVAISWLSCRGIRSWLSCWGRNDRNDQEASPAEVGVSYLFVCECLCVCVCACARGYVNCAILMVRFFVKMKTWRLRPFLLTFCALQGAHVACVLFVFQFFHRGK